MNARTLAASLLIASAAVAQAQVTIDSNGVGCNDGLAILSDGLPAAANVTFDYDAGKGWLMVTVLNTTQPSERTFSPVITRVYFNAPTGTVTGARLLWQFANGPTQPAFKLGFDADAGDGSDPNRAGCLGTFNFRLASAGIGDGIAAPGTDVCSQAKTAPLTGRVTFVILLSGPDVQNLTSDVFAASSSRNVGDQSVNVAIKFDGADCESSGTIGNGDACRTAVFVRGRPTLGETIRLCAEGAHQCRSFLGVSDSDGPSDLKTFVLPIGLPVLFTYDFGYFPTGRHEFELPVFIPFAPELIGMQVFMTSLTHPYLQEPWMTPDTPFSFAPSYSFTISGDFEQPR